MSREHTCRAVFSAAHITPHGARVAAAVKAERRRRNRAARRARRRNRAVKA